jgi:hypothetical protein
MRTFALEQIRIDQGHNPSAQRLILFKAARIEDLEPDLEIRVTNESGRILLITFFQAVQEPALIWIRVFWIETRIQALDNVPGKTIVDPRAIVFAKDEPRLALRIPDDVLPTGAGTGDEEGPL